MPRYVSFFTYSGEAWAGMVRRPEDRAAAARAAVEDAGGEMECFYWVMGRMDGFAVYSVPDEVTAAGIAAAVAGSGRVARLETFQVLDMDEGRRALERARDVARAYRPPGGPSDWMEGYDQLG
jgi:uncharacterized protein with GYD domain